MRVLQLHNHHLSKGGAMEVLAHEGQLLREGGHEVEEYTLPAAEELGLSAVRAGLKAIWNVEASKEVTRRIAAFAPDVVHVHTPFPLMSPAVFRAADRAGVPAVTTLHSYRWSCIAATCFRDEKTCEDCIGSRFKLAGVRHRCYHDSLGGSAALTASLVLHRSIGTLDKIDRFITLTGWAKQLLIRDGVPARQIVVKANSVPDAGVRTPDDVHPYVLFAGRLIDVKGVETLLKAWPQVAPGLTLKIAGDGELRPMVEEHAARDESIEFLGWRSEDEISELMGGAQVVVVPSEWYEGLPLVILRALSVGAPIVVSNLDNICAEVVQDDAGVAFEVASPVALAAALDTVLADRGLWRARRAKARASFEARYSPTGDLTRLIAIYDQVLSERGSVVGRSA